MLIYGIVRIIEVNVKRITENGRCFLKETPCFSRLLAAFPLVPLIIHVREYSIWLLRNELLRVFTSIFEFAKEAGEGVGLVVGV